MIRTSLVMLLTAGISFALTGCENGGGYKKADEVKKAAPAPKHDHGDTGPHGGGIIELGDDEYHAELVVNDEAHLLTLYILQKDAKTPEPVAATELVLTPEGKDAVSLKATPQKDDPEGKSSKFEVTDEALVHGLKEAGFVHGEVRVTVRDTPFIGHIDYHLDGDHDHDHGKEEKK